MENLEIQLKVQALQISSEHLKNEIKELEKKIEILKKDSEEKLENYKKSVDESSKNELKELEKKWQIDINNTNLKLSKISNFLSFEGIGKRLIFIASIFGGLQVLFHYVTRLFK